MQYLPIYPEQSWDDYWLSPTQQIGMERIEGLPLYSAAYNMMLGNTKQTQDLPAVARVFYSAPALPVGMLTDGLGQIGSTAYNGYKRAYNYGANAYNNLVDRYNNYQTQRHLNYALGNSNTGRRIVGQPIVPTLKQNLPTRATRYLVGPNGNIVAQIVD